MTKRISRYKALIFLLLVIVPLVSVFPVAYAKSVRARGFLEDFNTSRLPKKWYTASWHGTYSVAGGSLNLQSADDTPWASISVQSNCRPKGDSFKLSARVRNNGGYGVYFGLFVSNQLVDLTNTPTTGGGFENTIAISDTYDGFYNGLRHLSPTTFPPFLSTGAVGAWYVLELVVSKNPYEVTVNVYNDNNVLVGSSSRTDMTLQYSEISVCGVIAYRGVVSIDSLANYDVDWIKGEHIKIKK